MSRPKIIVHSLASVDGRISLARDNFLLFGDPRWMYKEFPGEEWAGWHLLVLAARQTSPEYLA